MPLIAGSLSTRLWRAVEPLPPHFSDIFERNLKRFAFRPVDVDKGELRSMGWVNLRQVLDARLTMKKVMFRNTIAMALRIDRVTINQRLFRATLAEEVAKALRERGVGKLSREQRGALEASVRLKLVKAQAPSMSIYEMAWHLENGLVIFSATGEKLNVDFSDLFSQTFNISIDPLFPYLRAERWAKKQNQIRDLHEVMPSPFSSHTPVEVHISTQGEEE